MTKTKVTIDTGTKKYISVDIAGHGKDDTNYDVMLTLKQLNKENFPSFNGNQLEWDAILNTASVKIENLGVMQ